jgi:hypothetical protein
MNKPCVMMVQVLLLVLSATSPAFSDDSTGNDNYLSSESRDGNLYNEAIYAFLQERAKEYEGRIEQQVKKREQNTIIFEESELTEYMKMKSLTNKKMAFPLTLGEFDLAWGFEQIVYRYKNEREFYKNMGNYPVIRVFPLNNAGERFQISFSEYRLSNHPGFPPLFPVIRRFKVSYLLKAEAIVYIKYDCKQQTYAIDKVEYSKK